MTGNGRSKESWFRRALASNSPRDRRAATVESVVDLQAQGPSTTAWDPWEVWLKRIEQPRRERNR